MILLHLTMLANFLAHTCVQCVVQPTPVGVTQATNWLQMEWHVKVKCRLCKTMYTARTWLLLSWVCYGFSTWTLSAAIQSNLWQSSVFPICIDINECFLHNGGCSHTCENSQGAYRCTCPSGLMLNDDQRICTGTGGVRGSVHSQYPKLASVLTVLCKAHPARLYLHPWEFFTEVTSHRYDFSNLTAQQLCEESFALGVDMLKLWLLNVSTTVQLSSSMAGTKQRMIQPLLVPATGKDNCMVVETFGNHPSTFG